MMPPYGAPDRLAKRPMFDRPDEVYVVTEDTKQDFVYWFKERLGDQKWEAVCAILRAHGLVIPYKKSPVKGEELPQDVGFDTALAPALYQEIRAALQVIREAERK